MPVILLADWGDDLGRVWAEALRRALPDERLHLGLRGLNEVERAAIDVAVVANPRPGQWQALPGLRLIQSLWAGVDRLLADTSLPAQVPLARMVDPQMNLAMAETAAWAVLALQRDFFRYAAQQTQGLWRLWPQRRADETRVGLLGLGQMGRAVARHLCALGYPVTAWRRGQPAQPEADLPRGLQVVTGDGALPGLLAGCDVLVNLLPLTDATRGLLDAARLQQLPRGAALVNLARGAHLVEADLLQALDRGHLSHAVLDVFAQEPLPAGHPFWAHPAITVLPHAAAQTDPRSAAEVVATNVRALRQGRPLAHLVDRQRHY